MTEKALALLTEKKFSQLKQLLSTMNPVDLAGILEEMPQDSLPLVYRLLPKELAAEAFAEMDNDLQEILIQAFSDKELQEVLDELYLDDAVDIIEEMPANVVKRILRQTSPEVRKKINEILHYPEDSAGSIMTIEYVDLKKTMTVDEAFSRIRATGVDKETIYTCYVTNHDRKLEGLVTVRELLLSPKTAIIGEIMQTHVIAASTLDDKEKVANQLQKYDFLALPVVDQEYRLVGIVTFDDAMDVLQEENTEDIEMMAAITPTGKPYLKTSTTELWKKRVPWLLLLMVSATFTGKIIQAYESALAAQVALTAFIPMLMDTGGNAGSQASVTIIRGLSLGEIRMSDLLKIIWKEIRVAILCGLTLSVANFAKMMLLDQVGLSVSLVVCLTLVVTVTIAKITGCTLPIVAKRIGFDPAVMASPFITTIVDALSLIVYFNFASMLLHLG
ncbi:MAG: magnesium transporter [Oscillospiraceae bacterium]|nr:magnesium transporter [Oscillospiraceae bacterium]MDD7041747.1 magnesium transporter [Oscillospiraceae bacterium]MDY2611724.1 magnesium transporter [Oscillospiraceae bacterium]